MKLTLKKVLSLVLVAALALTMLAGCGGDSADDPAKLGSAGAFSKWFGSQKKSLTNNETPGTYYFKVTKDISLSKTSVIDNGHTVIIDLDGHTITNKKDAAAQAFQVSEGAALILKNGTIDMAGADADGGLIAVDGAGCRLELTDMVLTNHDDSQVAETVTGGVLYVNSPVESADAPAVVVLKGSTVITGSPSGIRRTGGTITAKGNAEIHMFGGTIQNGQAGSSGNIHMMDQTKFYMHDGTITGGRAVGKTETSGLGGNVDMRGKARFYLYGGTISNGFAEKNGGNIFLSNFGTEGQADSLHLYGGSVEAGCANSGGNIYATDKDSVIRMFGGSISGGEAMSGGNIYLESAGLVMRGGTLTGLRNSTVNVYGGNVFCSHGTVSLYDGTIEDGMVSGSGGNLYLTDSVIDIYGSTVTGGTITSAAVDAGGGNLFAGGESVVNMYAGTITRGVSNYDKDEEGSAAGPNVMIAGHTQMHMFGGEISDGLIHGKITRGAGVYVYGQAKKSNTWFHMYGGEIRNGETEGTMRGMAIGAYGESNNTLDTAGKGAARIFGGTINFTGPENSEDKRHVLYTNRSDMESLRIYDVTGLEGLYRGATLGACEDSSHNVEAGSQEATCVTPGWTKYSCATCGDWYKITAEATGHSETTNEIAATATEAGCTEHACSACGETWKTDVIPAAGE